MGCGASSPAAPLSQVIDGQLINSRGETQDANTLLLGKVKVLYFASHSTGYQLAMQTLVPFINAQKAQGKQFEVVFVSSDPDHTQFSHHLAMGPWWAVPYEDSERRAKLTQLFSVAAPPAIILIGTDDSFICSDGLHKLFQDPTGDRFPDGWRQQQQEQREEENEGLGALLDF